MDRIRQLFWCVCILGHGLGFSTCAPARSDEPADKPAVTGEAPIAERVFRLQVLGQQQLPLPGASIIVLGAVANSQGVSEPLMEVLTDADGNAVIDLSGKVDDAAVPRVNVLVWKSGYGISSAALPRKEPLRLSPPRTQSLRISGIDSEPLAGAKVSLETLSPLAALPATWAHDFSAVTDQYGMCHLPLPIDATNSSIRIQPATGAAEFANIRNSASTTLPRLDQRDTVFIRLAPTGSIAGSVPRQLASAYRFRLVSVDQFLSNPSQPNVYWRGVTEPDEAGKFEFRDVVAGHYKLHAERKTELGPAIDALADEQLLIPIVQVKVQPAETTELAFEPLIGAKVHGRIVSEQADADYSRVKIGVYLTEQDSNEPFHRIVGSLPQAACDAQGNYTAMLPPGNYQFTVASGDLWLGTQPQSLAIGPGAAMVRVADLKVRPAERVNARIADESWKELTAFAGDALSALAIYPEKVSTSETIGLGNLSDQTVQVRVPIGMEPKELYCTYRNRFNLRTRVVDVDPSRNFELAIDRTASDAGRNIVLRVRVVDPQGNGLAHVPVRFTVQSQNTSTMSTGRSSFSSTYSRTTDLCGVLMSDPTGWVVLPPAQIFRSSISVRTSSGSSTRTTIETRAEVQAETLKGDGFSRSAVFTLEDKEESDLPDEIRLDDIVLEDLPAQRSLAGRLLSEAGEPLAGRVVWLAQTSGIIRGVTDKGGEFHFDGIDRDAWFLSDVNWSILKVADLPDHFDLRASDMPRPDAQVWSRPPLEERRKMAAEQLEKALAGVGNAQLPVNPGSSNLPAEAYLEPDKYFEVLAGSRSGDRSLDLHRVQFAQLWSELEVTKVRRLVEAAGAPIARARLLKILADRQQDPKIYEEAMIAFEFEQPQQRRPLILPPAAPALPFIIYDANAETLVSELGVELFRRGLLEPHLGKISAVVERDQKNRERINRPQGEGYELAHVALCRALLDPNRFLRSLDELEPGESGFDPVSRSRRARMLEIATQMYPEKVLQWPADAARAHSAWREVGKSQPLEAVQRLLSTAFTDPSSGAFTSREQPSRAFLVCESALRARHDKAVAASQEVCRAIRDFDLAPSRYSSIESEPSVARWCLALCTCQPEMSRQAKWHAALYHFRKVETQLDNILFPALPDAESLKVALCLADQWPTLAHELAERTANQIKRRKVFQGNPSTSGGNSEPLASLLAYFLPDLAVSVVESMQAEADRRNAAKAAAPAGARRAAVRMDEMNISAYRIAIVRGLLLNENQLIAE